MSFAEFIESVAESKNLSVEPWQQELVRSFEDRGEIFPGMPRRDMRWEFHWTTQLMYMRACWVNGIETKFVSPEFELRKLSPSVIIYDEWEEL